MKPFNKYSYWVFVSMSILCGIATCAMTPFISLDPILFVVLQILLLILSVIFALNAKIEIDRLKFTFRDALKKANKP